MHLCPTTAGWQQCSSCKLRDDPTSAPRESELEAMSDQQLEVAGPVKLLPVPPHHLDLGVVVVLGKLLHCCLKLRHSAISVGNGVILQLNREKKVGCTEGCYNPPLLSDRQTT